MKLIHHTLILTAILLPLATPAQQPTTRGATVTGTVLCADTSAPARFAKVLLKSTTPKSGFGDDFIGQMQKLASQMGGSDAKPTDEDTRRLAAASKAMNQATDMLSSSTVGLDGAFTLTGIQPGTYYVHAVFPGYIDPISEFTDEDFASADPTVKSRIASRLQSITITGADSQRVTLRLERGAAISGRILFDDGSPAAGWVLTTVKPKTAENPEEAAAVMMSQALAMSGNATVSKTDDLGRFRIAGLRSGEYVLRASLTATGTGVSGGNIMQNGSGINLIAYSGDTFTRADSKSISVGSGEDHLGADITIPAHKLHNISGHVYSKSDSHALNNGSVTISIKGGAGLPIVAAIHDDGSFRFEYLPSGAYTLRTVEAADARTTGSNNFMGMSMPKQEVLHKYSGASADVILADSDVDSVKFSLDQTNWTPPVKKPGEKDPDIGDILGGLFSSDDKADKKDDSK